MFKKTTSVNMYISSLKNKVQISRQEENELAKRVREGDKKAERKLLSANLRFVVSVARHYANGPLELDDLIAEGNLGLIRAAKRFDHTKHYKFISYAIWWIRQAILAAVYKEANLIRLPASTSQNLKVSSKEMLRLENKKGRLLTTEEKGKILNVRPDRLNKLRRISKPFKSLDAKLNDGRTTIGELVPDKNQKHIDDEIHKEEVARKMKIILLQLKDEKSVRILSLYFGMETGMPYTLEEISWEIGLTRERIRQIKKKALEQLRGFRFREQLKQINNF